VLLDEDGRSWLLEVNTNAGLFDFGNAWARDMMEHMLRGLKRVAIDTVFAPSQPPPPEEQGGGGLGEWQLVWQAGEPPAPSFPLSHCPTFTPLIVPAPPAEEAPAPAPPRDDEL
jgi:hypothetical protein